MAYALSLTAAIGCATCNGIAAILQKVSADREPTAASLKVGILLKLLRDLPFVIGTALDLVAGLLILVAVHSLPLFLVQSVIGSGIVITFIIERYRNHTPASYRLYLAIGMVLVGLITLAITAAPETAKSVGNPMRLCIILAPLLIALLGALCSRIRGRTGTTCLALLAGLAFGGTSVAGRILTIKPPLWHIIENPLLYAFIAYGILGLLLFSMGLQRTSATALNTLMVASETLGPALIGVLCFGDTVRHGLWLVAIIAIAVTLTGIMTVSTVAHHAEQPG